MVLGGKNAVYKFRDEDDARFASALASLGRLGASFLVTPSRRTHERLLKVADEATRDFPRILWDRTGANPYGDFLAHADLLVVTADSVNMTGEACATGKPVLVFTPSGGSAKFRRFHAALEARGATRPLPEHVRRDPAIGATSPCTRWKTSRARSSAAGLRVLPRAPARGRERWRLACPRAQKWSEQA